MLRHDRYIHMIYRPFKSHKHYFRYLYIYTLSHTFFFCTNFRKKNFVFFEKDIRSRAVKCGGPCHHPHSRSQTILFLAEINMRNSHTLLLHTQFGILESVNLGNFNYDIDFGRILHSLWARPLHHSTACIGGPFFIKKLNFFCRICPYKRFERRWKFIVKIASDFFRT